MPIGHRLMPPSFSGIHDWIKSPANTVPPWRRELRLAIQVFRAGQLRHGPWLSFFRASENLAYNFGHADPAARAMETWLDSSAHRREMERGTFRLTGIGVARTPDGKYFFTQLFLHPKR